MPIRLCLWAATLILATGVAALLCDHFQLSQGAIIGMHALFGLVVTASLSAVFLERAHSTPGPELYLQTRLISRWMYILLYVLAIVRVGLYLLEANLSPIAHSVHHALPPPRALDDFQYYITCCIAPLWLLRALILIVPTKRAYQT
jgi:hypothetical protein